MIVVDRYRSGRARRPMRQCLRLAIMNGSKPYSPSGQQRLPTSRPERRIGPACSAFPSPRPSPAGRGRNVRRAGKNHARLMVRNGFDCSSLSRRERVRVRGKAGHFSGPSGIPPALPHPSPPGGRGGTPGTVELRESSGRAGGFSGSSCSAQSTSIQIIGFVPLMTQVAHEKGMIKLNRTLREPLPV